MRLLRQARHIEAEVGSDTYLAALMLQIMCEVSLRLRLRAEAADGAEQERD
jgi:hypothetical protein